MHHDGLGARRDHEGAGGARCTDASFNALRTMPLLNAWATEALRRRHHIRASAPWEDHEQFVQPQSQQPLPDTQLVQPQLHSLGAL